MKRLWFESYLAMINNSVGSNLFRNFYIESGEGKREDVMNNGEFSSAFFVSSLLYLFEQQKKSHATVNSTIKDLLEHDWQELDFTSEEDLKSGDVIVWEEAEFEEEPGTLHSHIGFYVGEGQAVSNSYKIGQPVKHQAISEDRKITKIYRGKDQFAKLPQPEVEQKSEQS